MSSYIINFLLHYFSLILSLNVYFIFHAHFIFNLTFSFLLFNFSLSTFFIESSFSINKFQTNLVSLINFLITRYNHNDLLICHQLIHLSRQFFINNLCIAWARRLVISLINKADLATRLRNSNTWSSVFRQVSHHIGNK